MGGAARVRTGDDAPRELVAEVEAHVRALLRDVLCGYLDADLKAVADDILVDEQPEPEQEPDREPEAYEPEPYAEIEARDLRRQRLPHEAPQAPPPRFERAPEAEQV